MKSADRTARWRQMHASGHEHVAGWLPADLAEIVRQWMADAEQGSVDDVEVWVGERLVTHRKPFTDDD